jgi:hypothetical protein
MYFYFYFCLVHPMANRDFSVFLYKTVNTYELQSLNIHGKVGLIVFFIKRTLITRPLSTPPPSPLHAFVLAFFFLHHIRPYSPFCYLTRMFFLMPRAPQVRLFCIPRVIFSLTTSELFRFDTAFDNFCQTVLKI